MGSLYLLVQERPGNEANNFNRGTIYRFNGRRASAAIKLGR